MSAPAPAANGRTVPERFIPTPPTISAEAQALLNNPMFQNPNVLPAADDLEGWRAHAAQANAMMTGFLRHNLDLYPADVTEHALPNCTMFEITPRTLKAGYEDRANYYIHGGGFFAGFGEVAMLMALPIASMTGLRTFSIDYRCPPDHRFPKALDDCLYGWRWLLERYRPEHVAFHGGSAGANLGPACILRGRDEGLPLPGAAVLHSPATDLTHSSDTFHTNQGVDVVLSGDTSPISAIYAGDHDRRDPYLSPMYADFSAGFCPTLLSSGTRDLFLSNTVIMHRQILRAGVRAELHVWEAMSHGIFHGAPEEAEWYAEHTRFTLDALGVG